MTIAEMTGDEDRGDDCGEEDGKEDGKEAGGECGKECGDEHRRRATTKRACYEAALWGAPGKGSPRAALLPLGLNPDEVSEKVRARAE